MSINYPNSIDTLSNPIGTDKVNNSVAGLKHSVQHSNANDAIEALEAKVGVDGSAVTTSHDFKLSEIVGADKAVGKTATQTLTNKTLTAPTITGLDIADNEFLIHDNGDITKKVAFEVSGVAAATTRTKTFQDVSGTIYETGGQDVAIADGGTGQSTKTAAFDALSPTTTKADIVVNDGTNNVRLGVGADNTVIVADASQPTGLRYATVGSIGSGKIAIDSTQKAVVGNTATLTQSYTVAIAGGTLSTNNGVRWELMFSSSTLAASGQITVSATYGGQSMGTSSFIANLSLAGSFTSGGILIASGSTGNQKGSVKSNMNISQDINKVNSTGGFSQGYAATTVDSTVSQNLVVTFTVSNLIGNAFTAEGIIVEKI